MAALLGSTIDGLVAEYGGDAEPPTEEEIVTEVMTPVAIIASNKVLEAYDLTETGHCTEATPKRREVKNILTPRASGMIYYKLHLFL